MKRFKIGDVVYISNHWNDECIGCYGMIHSYDIIRDSYFLSLLNKQMSIGCASENLTYPIVDFSVTYNDW